MKQLLIPQQPTSLLESSKQTLFEKTCEWQKG